MMKRLFISTVAWLPLAAAFLAVDSYGQAIHTLEWPNNIASIRGSSHLLFLRDSKELRLIAPGDGKPALIEHEQALEGFDSIVFTPSGSVLVTKNDDQNLHVFKLNKDLERSDFATLPQGEIVKPYTLVVNESDTVLWIVSHGAAVAFDVESKKVLRQIKSYSLSGPDPGFEYLASQKDLVVASFRSFDIEDGWKVEVFREKSDRNESLLSLKRTLFLSLLVGPNGDLLVCAREDLHWPNTGQIACFEASTFKQKWKVEAIFPLSGCILNELLWIDDGSRFLHAYRLKDGTLAHKIDVDKDGLRGLAVVNNPPTIFSVSTDRKKLYSFNPIAEVEK